MATRKTTKSAESATKSSTPARTKTTKSVGTLDQFMASLDDLEPVDVTTDGPAITGNGDQDLTDIADGDAKLAFGLTDNGKVRTKRQAIEWALDQVKRQLAIYAGLCLMFVRLCFNVDPLNPDAKSAWMECPPGRRHPFDGNYAAVPAGKAFFYRVGEHWHVVITLPKGRCVSSDVVRYGYVNIVRLEAIADAWAAEPLGYVDELNGEYPVPAPRPRHRVTTRQFRIRFLRAAIARARAAGDHSRAARLHRWLNQVRA